MPTTTGQLATVEEIGTDHSGEAFVSDPGEATTAVVAGTHRYALDAAGRVFLHEKNRFGSVPRDEKQSWHKIVTYVPTAAERLCKVPANGQIAEAAAAWPERASIR